MDHTSQPQQSSSGSRPTIHLSHPLSDQIEALKQMEEALSQPDIEENFRNQFLGWSQALVDLNFLSKLNSSATTTTPTSNPDDDDKLSILEKDAHKILDWAIELGTEISKIEAKIYDAVTTAEQVKATFNMMAARVNLQNSSLEECEENYHKMKGIMQTYYSIPSINKLILLDKFISLYRVSLNDPIEEVKHRIVIVEDEPPYNKVQIPLNITTTVEAVTNILKQTFRIYGDLIEITGAIRDEFFVPIETRIPDVASRTVAYLNNVAGSPSPV